MFITKNNRKQYYIRWKEQRSMDEKSINSFHTMFSSLISHSSLNVCDNMNWETPHPRTTKELTRTYNTAYGTSQT